MLKTSFKPVWRVIDAIAVTFSQGNMLARSRAANHPFAMIRLQAQRDQLHYESCLLRRELAIHRRQRAALPPRRRSYYRPADRAAILQLMRLRGWSVAYTAERFLLHANTIRNWKNALNSKSRSEQLLGKVPWNRFHDAVLDLVHEMKELCPEYGSRTIAQQIVCAGIKISRTSVRRIKMEEPPRPQKEVFAATRQSFSKRDQLLKLTRSHQAWHWI